MTHRHTSKLYQGPCCSSTCTDPDLDSYKTTKKKKNAESLKCKLCPSPDEMGCIPLKSELSGVEDSSSCRPVGSLPLKGPNMTDCPESSKVKHSLQRLSGLSDNMEEIKESNETVNISVPNNSAHPDVPVNASDSGVITEAHVIINITGFSAFGIVKDEDSPPDPVRALILLFYKPPTDSDVTSFLNVLILSRNIVIQDLMRTRKELAEELFIEMPPHCKLVPKQLYTLTTCPGEDSVLVQPTEAEFDGEYYKEYFPSFQVVLKALIRDINLSLVQKSSSSCVWKRDVRMLPSKVKTSLFSSEQLNEIQSSVIDKISGANLKSLLDKLLEKNVITDNEREEAEERKNTRDKARYVIDTVKRKDGPSEMIEILCDIDPFLCKKLKLI